MRPPLSTDLPAAEFKKYYWLKEELVEFCRSLGISATGGKAEIAARLGNYLEGVDLTANGAPSRGATARLKDEVRALTLDTKIEATYRSSEVHRAFFLDQIGPHFKFNVPFMNWMKANSGRTYREAISEWKRIDLEKRSGKKVPIGPQFEFNQYTREFFGSNPKRTRSEMILCWNYKKSLPGHHRYEDSDLSVLTKEAH